MANLTKKELTESGKKTLGKLVRGDTLRFVIAIDVNGDAWLFKPTQDQVKEASPGDAIDTIFRWSITSPEAANQSVNRSAAQQMLCWPGGNGRLTCVDG